MNIQKPFGKTQAGDYDQDFLLWLEAQTAALRAREFDQVDLPNLLEEIEDLGKSLKRELENRLETILVHLIKLSVSVAEDPKPGWRRTVREQRRQVARLLRDSPSLKRHANEVYPDVLASAKSDAYLALIDFEPERAEEYEAAIKAGWDVIDIEQVFDTGWFLDIVRNVRTSPR